jgi:dienelactone hydrolase
MSLPMREPGRRAEPVPVEIQARYAFEPISAPPVIERSVTTRKYTVRDLQLLPPGSNTEPIAVLWYAPTNHTDCPLILMSPIGGTDTFIVPSLARFFAAHGYHAAIVKRPRGKLEARHSPAEIEEYLRQAVVRNRQALDWLLRQPAVDPHRAASFGISYGAILNAATAAVEPRLRCHVFVMAGAPLPGVIAHSAEHRLQKYRQQLRTETGMTDAQLVEILRAAIRTDPALLAPYVNSADILTFIALFDRSVGTCYGFELWRAQGEPQVTFIPTGHYSALLYLPFFRYQTMRFYQKKLAPESSP